MVSISKRALGTAQSKTTTLQIDYNATTIAGRYVIIMIACDTAPISVRVEDNIHGDAVTDCILLATATNAGGTTCQIWGLLPIPSDDISIKIRFASAESHAACATCWYEVTAVDQLANNTGTGTNPNITPNTTLINDEALIYAVATEGPNGDTAGTWSSGITAGQRLGTTGGTADTNQTISEGTAVVSTAGIYAGSKTGITSRDWAMCFVSLGNNTSGVPFDAPVSAAMTSFVGTSPSANQTALPSAAAPSFGGSSCSANQDGIGSAPSASCSGSTVSADQKSVVSAATATFLGSTLAPTQIAPPIAAQCSFLGGNPLLDQLMPVSAATATFQASTAIIGSTARTLRLLPLDRNFVLLATERNFELEPADRPFVLIPDLPRTPE